MTARLPTDHHCPDHNERAKAFARRGLRNCRIIHFGGGEEGYTENLKPVIAERLIA